VKWAIPDTAAVEQKNDARTSTTPVPKPILNKFDDISKIRNREDRKIVFATDADTSLRDFYWRYDRDLVKIDTLPFTTTIPETTNEDFTPEQRNQVARGKYMYELTFSNKGGMVMPIIIEWTFKDGSRQIDRIPVYVWRRNENKVTKNFLKDKEVASVKLDPYRETADIDEKNNSWPVSDPPSKFQLYKAKEAKARGAAVGNNPMQKEIK
jgi:hypothetical protein